MRGETPYTIIDAKDAPAQPGKKSAAAAEADGIIQQLGNANVARVEPEGTQTIRSLWVGLGRAAKRSGVRLLTWDMGSVLYVKLIG